jgi:hypothetical protein
MELKEYVSGVEQIQANVNKIRTLPAKEGEKEASQIARFALIKCKPSCQAIETHNQNQDPERCLQSDAETL